jgi:hypothetical protein
MESFKEQESLYPKGLQLLISKIVDRHLVGRQYALEVIAKVKEANGGVLKGLKYKKFFKLVHMVIKKKKLKVQEEARAEKQKWKETCHFCFKAFSSNQAKTRHIKWAHSDATESTIDFELESEHTTMNEEEVLDVKVVVTKLIEEIVGNVVEITRRNCTEKCPECNEKFSHQISLKRHMKQHATDLKYFQCSADKCEFKTLRKDNLWRHRRKVHILFNTNIDTLRDSGSNSEYICKMCKENFESDVDLYQTHILSKVCRNVMDNINTEGRFQCDLCPSSYTNKSGLTDHMNWKHKPAQVFSCDVCSKTFYNQYSFKRHRKGLHGLD